MRDKEKKRSIKGYLLTGGIGGSILLFALFLGFGEIGRASCRERVS